MTEEELIKFLKDNLKIKITKNPDYNVFGPCNTIAVKLFLGDECISRSSIVVQ